MKYYDINTLGFYEENSENRIEISDEEWRNLLNQQSQGGTIKISDGKVVCEMPSVEEIEANSKAIKKSELLSQIEAIDVKSIRALREGGVYDEASGKTYLEYYTEQISALRSQIEAL